MKRSSLLLSIFLLVAFSACDIFSVDEVTDPNSPSAQAVLNNASRGDLQNLATGLESAHRFYNNSDADWWSLSGSFGRELYYYNTSDPNFATAWLQISGATNAEDDPNFFVDASTYDSPYTAVRQANLLIAATENSESYTDQEKSGATGFANTIKAYQLMVPLQAQYQNGIRVDIPVDDAFNPGPFLSYDNALQAIRDILDDGASQLSSGGSAFAFELTDGFAGFDTPATMRQVNRAIAARAAVYAEDWQGALDALSGSFINETGSEAAFMAGPAHTFAGGTDQFNPYYYVPDADANRLVVPHPSWIADAEAGDMRVESKVDPRTDPATNGDIPNASVAYQHGAYATPTSSIPFIRNEELILIKAEALAQRNGAGDLADAVDLINMIRITWGLDPFVSTSQSEIIDQILFERRYSLWGEGHRWVDARRYGILGQLDTSVEGGRVPTQLARPQGEVNWEQFVGN